VNNAEYNIWSKSYKISVTETRNVIPSLEFKMTIESTITCCLASLLK